MNARKMVLRGLIAILVSSLTFSAEAQAQCDERVTTEIGRTEDGLMRAKEKVMEVAHSVSVASLERARSLLEIAFTINHEAYKNCAAGHGRLALSLTMEARKKGAAALAAINTREENEQLVERYLNKTDELLARIREMVDSNLPRSLEARLRRAVETQRRAWELFRSGHPRMALKLTREVERTAREVIRILRRHAQDEGGFERRFQTVEEIINHVRESLADCDNKSAEEVLTKASSALAEAKELFREGHIQQARTALRLARELAQRARSLCQNQDRQSQYLDVFKNKADRLQEEATTSDNRDALDLISKARNILTDAERLIADGLNEAASAQLKAAELLLRQAKRLLTE
ncbi:MAG: hypothetical protein IIB00_10550 [candidate division Zixibacteria bacterium]|nr:hypothetical protein [candidate division Zixibacteria bacterium]